MTAEKGGWQIKKQATAKATAGILRFAQNDKRLACGRYDKRLGWDDDRGR
jgi:hypothetical protein